MSQRPDEVPEEENIPDTFDRLLQSPDVQKAIAQIPDLIKANIEAKNTMLKTQLDAQVSISKSTTKWTFIMTGLIALAIIASVSFLAAIGKISSDAVSVVLGTVIGGAFGYLRVYLPRRD